MLPVLPTHFSGERSGFSSNGSMNNVMLREGEVQAIYYPGDDGNVSGKFVEYDVWAAHRANRTAVTKLYKHVIAIDHFGSVADFSFSTYRVKKSESNEGTEKELAPGLGSKVLLLCINGETNNAVILGGIRDYNADPDTKEEGHRHHTRFNGVDVQVNKDGELTVTYGGASQMDGTPADGVDTDATGSTIKFTKDGNVTIADAGSKNVVTIDHANDKVTITSDSEVDVVAPSVKIGSASATEPAVLGNQFQEFMTQLLTNLQALTVNVLGVPSTPPINAPAFAALQAQLQELLSTSVTVNE